MTTAQSALTQVAAQIATGKIRVIDLTQTLNKPFPPCSCRRSSVRSSPSRSSASRATTKPARAGTGTTSPAANTRAPISTRALDHGQGPSRQQRGHDRAENFIAPAVVIDASREVAANDDWLHDRGLPQGLGSAAWRHPRRRLGTLPDRLVQARGRPRALPQHEGRRRPHARPHAGNRGVADPRNARSTASASRPSTPTPASPTPGPWLTCHPTLMHGANRYGLQCLKNLDQLPPTGAVIVSAPLKIERLRAFRCAWPGGVSQHGGKRCAGRRTDHLRRQRHQLPRRRGPAGHARRCWCWSGDRLERLHPHRGAVSGLPARGHVLLVSAVHGQRGL